MLVECKAQPTAYVSGDTETTPDHAALNLTPEVAIVPVEGLLAYDAPIIITGSPRCGNVFEIPDAVEWWDCTTEERLTADGIEESVVQYHVEPMCPKCHESADFLVKWPDSPVPFDGLSTRDRIEANVMAIALDQYPDLADLPIEQKLRIAKLIVAGLPGGGADCGYSNQTEGAVALTAATAKTVIGYKSHANHGEELVAYEIGFDGVSAAAVPVLIEIGYCTWGANSPGTNSTSTTIRQRYGRVVTNSGTSGKTWSTEPTTITVLDEYLLSPNGGLAIVANPLGTEPDSAVSEGFVIRLTAPAAVNVRSTLQHRRG